MSDFVHLHCHSVFSPLDGVATPAEYFNECKARGYVAHALTEHGNMASVPDAYTISKDVGVKYILGCELYYNDYELTRRKMEESGNKVRELKDDIMKSRLIRQRHLTVLCKSTDGYKNLLNIRRLAHDYFFYKSRANIKLLNDNKNDLIVLSGCMNGPVSFELQNFIKTKDESYKKLAYKTAGMFKKVFGEDYYIELQMPGVEDDVMLFSQLFQLSKELKIKAVITNDAHYVSAEDYNTQRIMMAIDQDLPFDSPNLFISKSTSGYFKTREELKDTFLHGHKVGDETLPPYKVDGITASDFDEACDVTLEIASKCKKFAPDTSTKLPIIEDSGGTLWKLVAKGLKDRNLHENKEYKDRAKFEMSRIIEKEFCSYFLICRDLVRKSTIDLQMPVGPRGSAGGSLVCFLIGIHEIDPIKWGLNFDRFLSSSRGGKMLRVNMDSDEEVIN